MSEKNFKADCGCEIHVIKWNSKNEVLSVKNCPLHKAAKDLLEACNSICSAMAFGSAYGLQAALTEAYDKCRAAIEKAEGRA